MNEATAFFLGLLLSSTTAFDWPLEWVLFDVENNNFWYDGWGKKSISMDENRFEFVSLDNNQKTQYSLSLNSN